MKFVRHFKCNVLLTRNEARIINQGSLTAFQFVYMALPIIDGRDPSSEARRE